MLLVATTAESTYNSNEDVLLLKFAIKTAIKRRDFITYLLYCGFMIIADVTRIYHVCRAPGQKPFILIN